jgi:hypothetical protein
MRIPLLAPAMTANLPSIPDVISGHNRADQVFGCRNNDEAKGRRRNGKANRGCRSDKRDEHLALRALFKPQS